MIFERVGGAFLRLSIPTILFGLGIYISSPFIEGIEAFVETKHTAPWPTVGRLC